VSDDWTEIDVLTDATGNRLTVSHASGYVRIAVRNPGGVVLLAIVLDGEQRDQFMKAFADAGRQAEAQAVGHG
jgi:hypothetical protein